MRYRRVCLESLGYVLPNEIITSDDIEARLAPAYERMRLPAGRLELMTGIKERRFWPPGTLPSQVSLRAGRLALEAAGIDPRHVGALIHGSVCRDFLEPATACGVHRGLGLSPRCLVHDVSNACLGLLDGMLLVANMIELGSIRAGLVVGSEGSRELVENTIADLNSNHRLSRRDVKLAMASLTLGSASAALLLTDAEMSRTGNHLVAATARAYTDHHHLCRSERDEAVAQGMRPLMTTNAEALLQAGVRAGKDAFAHFVDATRWQTESIDNTVCHQVGSIHRRMILDALGLAEQRDFSSFEFLGNTGACALPVTLALGAERGIFSPGNRVALLGIGSGINVLMAGITWQESRVLGTTW